MYRSDRDGRKDDEDEQGGGAGHLGRTRGSA